MELEKKIISCYRKFLGRDPDPDGLLYFINEIKEGRIKINDLQTIFTNSKEFKKNKKAYSQYWKSSSFEHAKKLILSPDGSTPTNEKFNNAGQFDAEFISDYVKKDYEIVDYGCGIGRVAKFLSKKVRVINAIDISTEMLDHAKKFCKECKNINFIPTSGIRIPLEDKSVDFIYSIITLQHVEKEDAFLILREFNRILKNKRKIYVTFPDLTSETYWKGFEHYALNPNTRNFARARMYTLPEVEIMVTKAGFNIIDIPSNKTNVKQANIRIVAEKI